MTFDEIVRDVAKRLNLTSPEAFQRIGQRVNERYRKVTSSIGMITSRRLTKDFTIDTTLPQYSALPDLTFTGFEKILRITTTPDDSVNSGVIVLKQLTYDEIEIIPPFPDRVPRAFAVKRMGSHEVTVRFDAYPAGTTFFLHVEGYDVADILADDAEPFLPEDFHDVLIEGAMSDELRKMEKAELAQIAEGKYEQRLSDLRMFIAKNAYQDIAQGRDKPSQLWYRPWFSRISMWD